MEFTFCNKYVIQFSEEEAEITRRKIERILSKEVSPLEEYTAEDLAMTRCRHRQDTDAMMFDKWVLNIWNLDGNTTTTFTKPYCCDTVMIRALNSETKEFDRFELCVIEALDVIRDIGRFIWRSDDDRLIASRKRAAEDSADSDENVRKTARME